MKIVITYPVTSTFEVSTPLLPWGTEEAREQRIEILREHLETLLERYPEPKDFSYHRVEDFLVDDVQVIGGAEIWSVGS